MVIKIYWSNSILASVNVSLNDWGSCKIISLKISTFERIFIKYLATKLQQLYFIFLKWNFSSPQPCQQFYKGLFFCQQQLWYCVSIKYTIITINPGNCLPTLVATASCASINHSILFLQFIILFCTWNQLTGVLL